MPAAAPPGQCNGEDVTLAGTDGPDVLVGTPRRDVIHGGAGDDVIDGSGGGDLICGGDGDDRLMGGESFDALFGEGGDDVLEGGPGDDVLFVGPGLDDQSATGGPGYDVAYGDEGSETCAAEALYVCAVANPENDQRLPFALPAAVPCDLLASASGDDGNSGAPGAPFRTVERLVNTLQPGETGCLAPGEIFTEADQEVFVRSHGEQDRQITVRTIPGGPEATIRGRIWVSGSAHDVVFRDVKLDGTNGLAVLQGGGDPEQPGLASPTIDGHARFSHVDATNAGAGCFLLGSISSVVEHSTVHDCNGPGLLFGPGAEGAVLRKSVLERNRRAVVFEGVELEDGTYSRPEATSASRNIILDSILEDGQWQVEGTFDPDEDWSDNTLVDNCLFQENAMNIQEPRTAFDARSNVIGEGCPAEFGPDPEPAYPPPPVVQETVNLAPAERQVEVKVNGSRSSDFLPLIAPAQVRLGSVVDTSHGEALLTAAGGAGSDSLFIRGGAVKVRQSGGAKPRTQLRLTGAYVGAGNAAASSHRRKRRQWGRGKCRRCSIRGRYGRASRPRSEFLVEDRCKGTRVFVREGSVRFKDFVTGKTRRIKSGQSYVAKPRRRPC